MAVGGQCPVADLGDACSVVKDRSPAKVAAACIPAFEAAYKKLEPACRWSAFQHFRGLHEQLAQAFSTASAFVVLNADYDDARRRDVDTRCTRIGMILVGSQGRFAAATDPAFYALKFGNDLGPPYKDYLVLHAAFLREGLVEDGRLLPSFAVLGQRLSSLENILLSHQEFQGRGEVEASRDQHLRWFLRGTAKTSTTQESQRILRPEVAAAYAALIKAVPASKSARLVQSYLNLLDQPAMRLGPKSDSFLHSVLPES